MAPFLAAIPGVTWLSQNKLARDIVLIIAGLALAVIGYKTWKWNVERGVLRQAREEFDRRSAEREAEIVNTISENSNELVRESERVRGHPAVTELPDGTQGLPSYHYRREDGHDR
jgi:hypothetical protein